MPQTGVVDKATWYKIAYIFTSVKKLAELNSEGLRLEEVDKQFKEDLSPGMQNNEVKILQYFLAVIGAYYDSIMPVRKLKHLSVLSKKPTACLKPEQ